MTDQVKLRKPLPEDQTALYDIWLDGFMDLPGQATRDVGREVLSTPKYAFLYMCGNLVVTALLSIFLASTNIIPKAPQFYLATVLVILFCCMVASLATFMAITYFGARKRILESAKTNKDMTDVYTSFSQPGKCFLVAEKGGEVIGCAAVFPCERGGQVKEGVGEVGRVSVKRTARGLGVASKLMIAIEQEARKLGYSSLYLITANNPAKKLYTKLGYKGKVIFKRLGMEAIEYTKNL